MSLMLLVDDVASSFSFTFWQCKARAEGPLYDGGILKGARWDIPRVLADGVYSPAFVLRNLTTGTKYCFSS